MCRRIGHLVVERAPGEGRVVRLDVDLVLALEPVPGEEAVDDGDVVVVLVLRRLHGLRLDEKRALESDPVLLLHDEVEEPSELLALTAQIRVEQRVVPLAAAPEHVVRSAETLRDGQHVRDLSCRIREDGGIRVRRRSRLVAGMAEQVGGAPEQARAGPLLVAERVVDELVEIALELPEAPALRRDVDVVEAIEGHAELLDELEGGGHLQPGGSHRIETRVGPRTVQGPDAEHVAPVPRERVPVGDADPKPVLHASPEDGELGVVRLEGERIGRAGARVRDTTLDIGEERLGHGALLGLCESAGYTRTCTVVIAPIDCRAGAKAAATDSLESHVNPAGPRRRS